MAEREREAEDARHGLGAAPTSAPTDGPRLVEVFPHEVETIENVWIPMPDGARLAARLWLPADAATAPVPALVEYIPYRKRDFTRARDETMHRYFAGHGYAAVRIDVRGSGDSDGLLADEYTEEEHADGVAALRWIAAQPWCDGAIGMLGKSWGGFNALQIAALAPPELRAVVTVCSTDDRYADDAHYMGGALLAENLTWGAVLLTLAAQPPDPEIYGPGWRERWLARLEALPLYPERWLRHPRRDAYWRHGSVAEDYLAIRCPVYAVGGWADGYTNAVPRLLAGLRVPRKGLVGPWAHVYPHEGVPGPAIGFLQEALAWWDRWLRGLSNGIEHEPAYRVWLQAGTPRLGSLEPRPGRWVAEDTWPSARIRARALFATADGGLSDLPGEERTRTVCSPATVGLAAGAWCGFGLEGDLPSEQSVDDAGSLVCDGAPLAQELAILGAPTLELELASDRPQALLAVRLNDVTPDGRSERVTYGLLNLSHRDGHAAPRPLVPGARERVRVRLNDVAHVFARGNRVRLALSTAYWPVAWPSPERTTLTLSLGSARLELPERTPRPEDDRLRPFEPPEMAPPPAALDIDPGGVVRTTELDPATGEVVHTVELDTAEGGVALTHLEPIDLVQGHAIVERFRIHPERPLSARLEIEHETTLRRGAWSAEVSTRLAFGASAAAFELEATLEARENGVPVCRRVWRTSIPRDCV